MQPNSIHHQTAPREMDLYWLRESPAAKENRHLCAGRTWLPIRDRLSGREVLPSLDPISLLAPQLSGQGDVKGGFTPLYTFKKSDPCKKIWQIKARLLEAGLCFPLDTAQGTEQGAAEGAQGPAAQMSSLAGLSPQSVAAPPSTARQTHAHVARGCSTDDSQPWRHRLSLTGEAVPLHICSNHSCEETQQNPLKKERKKATTYPRHSSTYLFFNAKQCWEGIPCVGQPRLETQKSVPACQGELRDLFYFCFSLRSVYGFQEALAVKNLPIKAGDVRELGWVWSLTWEDPREEGMANHSRILVWRVPWIEESGGLQSTGLQRVGHELKRLGTHLAHTVCGLEHWNNNSDSN